MRQGLIVDTLRGAHSTGLAWMKQDLSEWNWVRRPMPGWDFVDWEPATKHIRNLRSAVAAIGHNRHATVGKVSTATAHPYEIGDVIGVHNGTLTIGNGLPDYHRFETDSMALINAINEWGPKDTFETAKGAFANVWFDLRDDTINFIRNSERDLYYAWADNNQVLLYASEAGMLEWIADRVNFVLDSAPEIFEEGVHYQMNLRDPKDFETTEYNLQPVSAGYVTGYGFGYSFTTTQGGGKKGKKKRAQTKAPTLSEIGLSPGDTVLAYPEFYAPYNKSQDGKGEIRGKLVYPNQSIRFIAHGMTREEFNQFKDNIVQGKPVRCFIQNNRYTVILQSNTVSVADYKPDNNSEEFDDDIPFSGEFRGPEGEVISREKWLDLVKDGCCICGSPITTDMADKTSFVWGDFAICPKCVEENADEIAGIMS